MWRGSSPWHPSPRLRAIGAALLPLLLVLALPACRTGTVCNAAIAPTPAPALTAASGAVYANEWGSVSALRGASGALVWHASVGFVPAATAAIVANGLVIVSTGAGKLSAIRISDGSRAWQSQPVPHPASGDLLPLPVPVVAGDTLYAAAGPGSVAAWRSADGSLLWQSQPVAVPVDPAYGTGYASLPEPVVAAGIVYFSAGQTVRAVRAADGSLLWSSPALQPENLYTPPVLADGRLFLVARDDSLYALDAGSGAVLWHAPDPGTAGLPFIAFPASPALPVVQDGVVYYAPLDGPRALATSTGALLWHLAAGDPSAGPSPVVAAGAVYVAMGGNLTVLGTRTGAPATLWALNARTGAVKWKTAESIAPGVPLIVHGDAIYATNTSTVAAWRASDGASLWQRTVQLGVSWSQAQHMVFADGALYLGRNGMGACGGTPTPPAVLALRATDGTLLWQTSVPVS